MDKAKARQIMSALSQETRFKIFETLVAAGAEGMAAGEISDKLKFAANSVSAHMTILSACGLVRSRKVGRSVIYRAVPQAVKVLVDILDTMGADPSAAAKL
jgi:DNA-binding transcriptional ArsR family regulator